MHYLIELDKEGKELKRTPKTRGRAPRGFERRADGSWYKTISNAVAGPSAGVESVTQDLPRVSTPAPRIRRSKGVQYSSEQVRVEDICRVCNCLRLDVLDDGVIVLHHPVVGGETGVDGLEFNSLYSRIELDQKSGNIRLFLPNLPDGPPIIIHNALLKGESDAN